MCDRKTTGAPSCEWETRRLQRAVTQATASPPSPPPCQRSPNSIYFIKTWWCLVSPILSRLPTTSPAQYQVYTATGTQAQKVKLMIQINFVLKCTSRSAQFYINAICYNHLLNRNATRNTVLCVFFHTWHLTNVCFFRLISTRCLP